MQRPLRRTGKDMGTQPPISDYAMIGDCETAALIASNGSIDWLCWPRFDSSACFAALLGSRDNGYWKIAPAGTATEARHQYLKNTLVLETFFRTADGSVTVTDFMPLREAGSKASEIVRIVTGIEGEVPMKMTLAARFDYGRIVPWTAKVSENRWRSVAGPHATILDSSVPVSEENLALAAEFRVRKGERVSFVLTYEASHLPLPPRLDADEALTATARYWTKWSDCCQYSGRWPDAVMRSLLTIKALTYRPTGGVLAALTTSLPEKIGSSRNWDYRYCWLRDTMFTLQALIKCGYRHEAEAWSDWLLRAVAGKASQIQPLYGICGEHRSPEMELPWLSGYHGSQPVRTGNAAYSQCQLDVYGSVMDTLHVARDAGLDLREAANELQQELMAQLEQQWQQPDEGIWEVRSDPQHFVHTKVMCWVAFDRAISASKRFGLDGPVERWRKLRDTLHEEVLKRGFDPGREAFTQAYGSTALDASVLLIPLVGFLPPDDPRVLSTAQVIEKELSRDGLILRYDTAESEDGLPEGEGAFLACSLWLADNMALQGRRDDAERLFERVLSLRNDVGLLSEQYDVESDRMVGNFPQAFSHFALVDTAFRLATEHAAETRAKGRAD
jgi:GH15 family glucan-1,4-alpha-glucosidase